MFVEQAPYLGGEIACVNGSLHVENVDLHKFASNIGLRPQRMFIRQR